VTLSKLKKNDYVVYEFLKGGSDSEWAAPTLIIPKKNGIVRLIFDFRKSNQQQLLK
jgi:hypothetical protein